MHSTLYGLPYTSSAGLQSAFGKVKDVYYLKRKKRKYLIKKFSRVGVSELCCSALKV